MNPHSSGRGKWIVLAIVVLASPGLASPEGAEHPTLPKVDAQACRLCHEDLLPEEGTIHAPAADDCTSCHEFTTVDGDMRVALAEGEPALCLLCHDDKSAGVEGELEAPHYPVTESCVTCHDPHATSIPRLLNNSVPAICNDCHDPSELVGVHKGQMTSTVNCVACHQAHGSDTAGMLRSGILHRPFSDGSCNACHRDPFAGRIRVRSRGSRLCEACHGKMDEAPEGGSSHDALRDQRGRAGCLNCHEPHLGDSPKLLTLSGTELCRQCHGSLVGLAEAAGGHPPAADDCSNCHEPHSGSRASLLLEDPGEICLMCHDAEDEDLAGSHLDADLTGLDCLSCHSPHGAGQSSSLRGHVHAPIADGCDTCHEGSATEVAEGGESTLCLMCHDDIGESASGASVPHPAMELARCADCHNPHASEVVRLVKSRGAEVCVTCHEDQAPGENEVAHAVIDLIGCQACHEPHGGSRASMLRETGDELCRSCHDKNVARVETAGDVSTVIERFTISPEQARTMVSLELSPDGVFGHPVIGHRVSGTPTVEEIHSSKSTFGDEMSCLTCHDPHKGASNLLFRWGAASPAQACGQCHPQ